MGEGWDEGLPVVTLPESPPVKRPQPLRYAVFLPLPVGEGRGEGLPVVTLHEERAITSPETPRNAVLLPPPRETFA